MVQQEPRPRPAPHRPGTPTGTGSGRGRRFWRAVHEHYDLSLVEVELLAENCRQLDLADRLRDAVGTDVVVATADGGLKTHPAPVELRQVRIELRRMMTALGLPDLGDEPSELPDGVSAIRTQRARRAALTRWGKGPRV